MRFWNKYVRDHIAQRWTHRRLRQ